MGNWRAPKSLLIQQRRKDKSSFDSIKLETKFSGKKDPGVLDLSYFWLQNPLVQFQETCCAMERKKERRQLGREI